MPAAVAVVSEPHYRDEWLTVYLGDCRAVLAELDAGSVHCVVTSPPYWGLRDYGTPGQLGLEETPDAYVEAMVGVFREIRRVLRDDGTVWLNLGDSFASRPSKPHSAKGSLRNGTDDGQGLTSWTHRAQSKPSTITAGLKEKDLVGIPWLVAFALRADGWYLRRDVIWAKPNPMPESVDDRPSSAHEYLFLLTKSPRYFYDAEAVREPAKTGDEARWDPGTNGLESGRSYAGTGKSTRRFGKPLQRPAGWNAGATADDRVGRYRKQDGGQQIAGGDRMTGFNDRYVAAPGRSLRSVWTIPTAPYPGAHFATFPRKLVEPCILAGTSAIGVCPTCGAPWARVLERLDSGWDGSTYGERAAAAAGGGTGMSGGTARSTLGSTNGTRVGRNDTTGWAPTCRHGGRPDDLDVIASPVGEGQGGDYHRDTHGGNGTGRRGLDRSRRDDEGTRVMYRWQQRAIADQLRLHPNRATLAVEVGEDAFAHYIRTDRVGARAVPPDVLARWLEEGVVTWPIDDRPEPEAPVPATVLDPFAGSGTVGLVAQSLSRRAVLVDLNADYLDQALRRNRAVPLGL